MQGPATFFFKFWSTILRSFLAVICNQSSLLWPFIPSKVPSTFNTFTFVKHLGCFQFFSLQTMLRGIALQLPGHRVNMFLDLYPWCVSMFSASAVGLNILRRYNSLSYILALLCLPKWESWWDTPWNNQAKFQSNSEILCGNLKELQHFQLWCVEHWQAKLSSGFWG